MKYRTVTPTLWTSRAFRSLPAAAPSAQLLYLYLLTSPEVTAVPGVVTIGEGALAEALRWTPDETRAQLSALERAMLVRVDRDARLVTLPAELALARPANPNVSRHWAIVLAESPECDLRDDVVRELFSRIEPLGEPYAKPFRERFGEPLCIPFGEPFPKPFAQPSRNHDHDHEPDHDPEHDPEHERDHDGNRSPNGERPTPRHVSAPPTKSARTESGNGTVQSTTVAGLDGQRTTENPKRVPHVSAGPEMEPVITISPGMTMPHELAIDFETHRTSSFPASTLDARTEWIAFVLNTIAGAPPRRESRDRFTLKELRGAWGSWLVQGEKNAANERERRRQNGGRGPVVRQGVSDEQLAEWERQ